MAKQRYVDWDGLVYYDGKIKSYIAEKMDACMRFMGDISSRSELPDPSYENLNQVFKLSTSLEIAITDTDFESSRRGAQYPAGTLVIVSDYDGVYLYDVLVQPAQNDPSVIPDLTDINERVSSIEDTLSEQDSRISDTENTIEQLGISIENTYARKDEVPSVEGLASKSYVDDKVGSITIPDVSGLASVEEVNDKVSEISDSIVETNTHISHIEEDIEAINDRALEHEKSLRDIHNLLSEKSDENHTHKTSELVNDSAFVKESQLSEYALNSSLAQYATKDYVDGAIANAEISGGDADVEDVIKGLLGNYYTKDQTYNKSEIDAKIPYNLSELTNDAGYVTEEELNSKGYITDVSNLATKQELQDAIDDIVVPDITLDGYATEQWVKDQGYITEHQDISGKADKEHTHKLEDIIDYVAPDFNGYATKDDIKDFASKDYVAEQLDNFITAEDVPNYIPESYVTADELAAELEKIEHPTVDLTGYYTKEEVDGLIPDTSKFIESIPDEYVTADELATLATKEELEAVQNTAGQNSVKLFQIDSDLVDINAKLDTIPTKTSDLTNDSGFLTEHQDISGKADKSDTYTKGEVDNLIPSLEGYAKTEDIPDVSKFITEIPSDYVTEDELSAKGYITSIPDDYAKKSDIPTDYVTDAELESKGYLTEHQSLDNYATKDLLNLKADSVLFKQDKWVNVAIGKFAVGDNVKDKTIAEILIGILGLTDSTSPDEPEEPQGLIATIIAKELPALCGTSESGLTATPWKTITLGDEYTELGFYSENNRNGYQLKFTGNTDLDAQVFAIPHGAKILAAYKYDLGGANEWLAQDVPPSFEWLEAGTTTVEVDGVTYTYDVYEYNVGDMGDALVVDEYWRIEIGE